MLAGGTDFEFIFPLMHLHALSFSSIVLMENLLNTNTLSKFSLLLSRQCFSWVPSVLLVASSSLLKKDGSNLSAHKCHSLSFTRVSWTVLIFDGVTHVPTSSLPTSCGVLADVPSQSALVSADWSSSVRSLLRVSVFIVVRSGSWFRSPDHSVSSITGVSSTHVELTVESSCWIKEKTPLSFCLLTSA